MRRRAIFYGLVIVAVLIGYAGGMIVNAMIVEAQDIQASTVLWSKQCAGDRIVVVRGFTVKCVEDDPTSTPRPTPTRAPTEKP